MAKKIDREVLAGRIRELEGLSMEERSALLELLNTKRYGLVWENHVEDVEERLREYLPVLKEETDKALTNGGEDAPNHILIEGDNLEALTALTYTHEGKVDVIYIDPPYNTGNKDFVYNDSYVDSEDGYRHSKWLSFMEKRLRIAKKLLSERGVIFISIDDNEQANLKLLCDEVFLEVNFLAQVIWEKAYAPVNLKKHFSENHDFIIAFARNKNLALCNGLPKSIEAIGRYKNPDNDNRGPWKAADSTVGPVVKDKIYPITLPSGRIVYPSSGRCWLYTKERFEEIKADNRVWFGPNGDSMPSIKKFASEVKQTMTPMTIWKYNEVGHSQDAAQEVKDIFDGEARFTYPKSIRLIERIIQLYSQNDSLILDFFAGSGTTLHATMQLNKEDGGHRKCILVTNNENNICEEVTYERNKRVINGYTTPKGEKVEGLHENNLRYYKVDFVERDSSLEGMRKLMEASTDLLCIKHDIYHEEHTFGSLKLKPHIARYFKDDNKQVLIIYKVDAIAHFVREIAKMPEGMNVMVYVFSINNYAMDADFEAVADKVTLCALPAAIYNAYLKVLPKKKIPIVEEKEHAEPTLFDGEEDKQ